MSQWYWRWRIWNRQCHQAYYYFMYLNLIFSCCSSFTQCFIFALNMFTEFVGNASPGKLFYITIIHFRKMSSYIYLWWTFWHTERRASIPWYRTKYLLWHCYIWFVQLFVYLFGFVSLLNQNISCYCTYLAMLLCWHVISIH